MSQPTVRLRQGAYRGKVLNEEPRHAHLPRTIEAFLGVPYAHIAAGSEGRFREARPLPAGDQTFDAVAYGPVCPGIMIEADLAEGWAVDEDCLSANVFRPAGLAAGGAAPVVVYVHGGAFNMGRGADRDMASFVAHAERHVVAVSFNYRIGPLGFLPSGVTEEEGVLNLGLRDQRALLGWVRENVSAFGGDEARVTVMGVSAGAHSIGHHILAPDPSSPPLFHRAILESGAATARSVLSPRHPRHETQFAEYLAHLGYPPSLPRRDILPRLRAEPLARLLEAAGEVWLPYAPSVRWPFQPAVDGPGGVIPAAPSSLWAAARAPPPLLTGFNSHEGAGFVPDTLATAEAFRAFFATLIPGLSGADLDELEALYPEEPEPGYGLAGHRGRHFPRAAAAYAHQAYVAPVLWTAGCAARRGAPVYVYEFAARGPVFGGAGHGEEGDVVVRDREAVGPHAGLARVAVGMHAMFSRFAAAGDPNAAAAAAGGSDGHGDGRLGGGDPGGGGDGGRGGGAPENDVSWPKFVPPFEEDLRQPLEKDSARQEDSAPAAAGQIVVFGEGNDERAGGANPGVVARVRTLTRLELRQCRFWWQRAHLSQGMGEGRG